MRCPNGIPFLKPGLALGAKRHAGFAEAWNWLMHSFWHMTLGDGLKWSDKWNGYPKINLKIEAGEGIDVDYTDGKVIISLGDGVTSDNESDGGGGEGPEDYDRDDGGLTGGADGGGTGTRPEGARDGGGGGNGGGGGMGGGGNGGGNGNNGAAGGDGGTSCNEFSDGMENSDGDPGLGNPADNCAILNGW